MSSEQIMELLKTGKIDYVRVLVVDVLGNVRSRSLRRMEFEKAVDMGVNYPESILYLDIWDRPIKHNFDDVIAHPDLTTFMTFPYLERTGVVLSALTDSGGVPSPLCVRTVLRKATGRLEGQGYRMRVLFEPTFYVLRGDSPADSSRAFSSEGLLVEQEFLKEVVKYLEEMEEPVQRLNKYFGRGQYEITFSPAEALRSADFLTAAKEVVRDVALLHGLKATFMSKPFSDSPGNVLHVYFSLLDEEDNNATLDQTTGQPSKIARNFLAGLQVHIGALSALALPTVNSYRRLREDFSPTVAAAGRERRFLLRFPANFKDTGMLEFRLPDTTANPYLLLTGMIYAGLEGVERGLELMEGIESEEVPTSLEEALRRLSNDRLMREALGEELLSLYVELKLREVKEFEQQVTQWERDVYLRL
ncbi:glutamine synthetase [Sulfodiicoccus acidiphilus]|uniref:Glutamine synthetase n=1 Tax=Sulfodiicoccus acidiphilus TaxID=1670455 RepID=A0A348B3M5_9CREN|nr:glutamine synthetase family protein [Sulfodiicoccus acidiphilus]BBD72777.1 glutamine synthetase [Sulfodiicoccus acidiphilus]GGT99723.1 glutamine synthetase [Sulfodiicoccus acidiphilus]